jgi:hypothetical protein
VVSVWGKTTVLVIIEFSFQGFLFFIEADRFCIFEGTQKHPTLGYIPFGICLICRVGLMRGGFASYLEYCI